MPLRTQQFARASDVSKICRCRNGAVGIYHPLTTRSGGIWKTAFRDGPNRSSVCVSRPHSTATTSRVVETHPLNRWRSGYTRAVTRREANLSHGPRSISHSPRAVSMPINAEFAPSPRADGGVELQPNTHTATTAIATSNGIAFLPSPVQQQEFVPLRPESFPRGDTRSRILHALGADQRSSRALQWYAREQQPLRTASTCSRAIELPAALLNSQT